jgi:hypothetical protein
MGLGPLFGYVDSGWSQPLPWKVGAGFTVQLARQIESYRGPGTGRV